MTITQNPTAVVYAKQRGISINKRPKLSAEGTVEELHSRLKDAGIKVTTKMRKAELLDLIEHNNRVASVSKDVDISKLTPKQRRRLRKRGVA